MAVLQLRRSSVRSREPQQVNLEMLTRRHSKESTFSEDKWMSWPFSQKPMLWSADLPKLERNVSEVSSQLRTT